MRGGVAKVAFESMVREGRRARKLVGLGRQGTQHQEYIETSLPSLPGLRPEVEAGWKVTR
jgi:hypothetical protein